MIVHNFSPRKVALSPKNVRYNYSTFSIPVEKKVTRISSFSVPKQTFSSVIPYSRHTQVTSPIKISTFSVPRRQVFTPTAVYSTKKYLTNTIIPTPTKYEVVTNNISEIIPQTTNISTSFPSDNYNVRYSTVTNNMSTRPIYSVTTQIPTNISTISNSYNYSYDGIEPSENFNPNEFSLMRLIGRGGYSEIFSVRWNKNGKVYIMKKCTSHDISDIKNERTQVKVLLNFIRNTGCDGVVKVYGERIMGSTQYILMELAGNDWEKELNDRKISGRYYTENELLNILRQLIQTLALLEKYNISHRDIKPKNILITNGKYKLADFSDSKNVPEGRATLLLRGTEIFMSPLLYQAYINNSALLVHDSYKSDVFSLGMCALYAACLNYHPLEKLRSVRDERVLLRYLKSLLGNRYSTRLINLLFWMLQIDENKRPNFVQLQNMI